MKDPYQTHIFESKKCVLHELKNVAYLNQLHNIINCKNSRRPEMSQKCEALLYFSDHLNADTIF